MACGSLFLTVSQCFPTCVPSVVSIVYNRITFSILMVHIVVETFINKVEVEYMICLRLIFKHFEDTTLHSAAIIHPYV